MRILSAVLVFLRRLTVSALLGSLLVLAAGTVLWFQYGDWVAVRLSTFANRSLFEDKSTRLTVGRVTGSVVGGLTFENVRLERLVGGEWRPAVEADRVDARYELAGWLRKRRDLTSLHVYGPRIEIAQDSTGRWVLPVGEVAGGPGGKAGGRLRIQDLTVTDGRLRLIGRDRGWEADSLSARAALHVDGGRVEIALTEAAFRLAEPVGTVSRVSGTLQVDGPLIRATGVSLDWEGAAVSGNFRWNPEDATGGLSGDLSLTGVDLARVGGLVETPALPDSGRVSGTVHLAGGRMAFHFGAALSGMYGARPVAAFEAEGDVDGPKIDVDRLRLAMPECDLAAGSGSLDLSGGGRIRAALDFNHLEVDSIPLKAVRWIPGEARGKVTLDVRNFRRGFGPIAALVDVDFTGREAFGVKLAAARGHIDHEEGRDTRVTNVVLVLPDGGRVAGRGLVHPGDVLDLDFTAETGDWSQLRSVIAIPGVAGAGRVTGRLVGNGKEPALDLSGRFTGVRGWQMAADSLELVHLTGPFAPIPEFDGTLVAHGLQSLGRTIDRVEMDYHWLEPRLTFPRLYAVDAETVAVTRGHSDFDPDRKAMHTVLDEGTLTIGALTWTPQEPVVIDGLGDRYRVQPARYASPAGSSVVAADFDAAAGTMDSRFTGMDIDLLVMAGDRRAAPFGGGMMRGDLELKGPIIRPDVSGQLVFRDYRWAGAVVDSAFFDFRTQEDRISVRRGWVDAGPGRLSLSGDAVLPDHAWIVWSRWKEGQPVAWERTVLDGAGLTGADVDLARWAALNPGLGDLAGRATGRARLEGPVGAPRLTVEAQVTRFAHAGYGVDSVAVVADYADSQLAVHSLHLAREKAAVDIRGGLPLELALYPPAARLIQAPMNLTVDLPHADLDLLPMFAPAVEEAGGSLTGHLVLRGTPGDPLAYGRLGVTGGRLRLAGREELLEDVEAEVSLDSTTVNLVSLSAREGKEGKVSASGTYELGQAPDRAYRIQVDLEKFIVRQSGDYAARFDGRFEIVPLRLADGTVRPTTVGQVRVDRAEVVRQFDQPQPAPDPGHEFYYSLSIDAPDNVFILNDVVDMELSGQITVRRTPDRSELIGELSILRGYYTLLLRRFRITSGTLNFNRVDLIDPEIDITAETPDGEYLLSVHLTGEASNPVIDFAARPRVERGPNEPPLPELTQQEIVGRLAPGGLLATQLLDPEAGVGTGELGINVLTGSVQLLLGRVQRDVARKLGLDEIRLDTSAPSPEGSVGSVSITKYVTPEVNVSYSQQLSGPQEQDLSLEYRLGRLIFLRGEFIRRRLPTVTGEEYNVDLRFWNEY